MKDVYGGQMHHATKVVHHVVTTSRPAYEALLKVIAAYSNSMSIEFSQSKSSFDMLQQEQDKTFACGDRRP